MKITVITVCFNSADTIEKTIQSVIEQKYHDLEYIVVDGGSTDGTLTVLDKYHLYIDKQMSEPDKGIYDAMNKGIKVASGDVIAFLNSDDWYEKNALNAVEEAFSVSNCDCVCCDNYFLGKHGDKVYCDVSEESFDELYIHMTYYHSALFCRKEFFEREGNFNLKYKIAADYDWLLRSMEKGAKLYYLHQAVFTLCFGGVSSVNMLACAWEARQIALKHLPEDKKEYRKKIDDRFYGIMIGADDNSGLYAEMIEILGKDKKNILWGAGVRGRQCVKWFKKMNISVDAIVDSNSNLWGESVQEVHIVPPDILKEQSCNLIITPENQIQNIRNAINKVSNENIQIYELKALCKMITEKLECN